MADSRNSLRQYLVVIGFAVIVGFLVWQGQRFQNLATWMLYDFVEYWSAGRLIARGDNPYSPAEMLPVQKEVHLPEDEPLPMLSPPWTLTLLIPFGWLNFGGAWLLWVLMNLLVVLISADVLWRFYGGSPRSRWIAWLINASFLPTFLVLFLGQIGPLILLGVVGFLYFERRNQGWWAGMATVLMAIKPQLVYLFWIALLLWSLERRRWSVLVAGLLTGLAATAVPLFCNPHILQQYVEGLAQNSPFERYLPPTMGSLLRLAGIGAGHDWLQFVPMLAGLAWFAWHWLKHRQTWEWSEQLPLLLLVSFLTTAYGAWPFDLVILLVPVIQAAVWTWHCRRTDFKSVLLACGTRQRFMTVFALTVYLAIDALAWVLFAFNVHMVCFVWMVPALLAGYLTLRWQRGRALAAPPPGAAPPLGNML